MLLSALLPAAAGAQDPVSSEAQTLAGPVEEEQVQGPVAVSVVYTSDVWVNARGGIKRAWRYLDNLDVTLAVDAERAFGWNGASLFFYGLYNNGNSLSEEVVGDLQVVSNIDAGIKAARLYEAWFQQRFAGDRASIRAGLYDLNSEFDTNDSNVLFLNSSHGIGPDFSQSGQNGPSIFPVTSLALRADYKMTDKWLVRAALLDAVPGNPARPARTAIKLGNGEGALVVAELEYRDDLTKATLGHWRYTSKFEHLDLSIASGEPVMGRGNDGVYVMAERKLLVRKEGQGLAGWLRAGLADQKYNPIRRYLGGGLVYTGPFAGRNEDKLGAAVGVVKLGSLYRRALREAGTATDAREINVEVTYRAPLTSWLTVQPDVQYVFNPGGDPELKDALVMGVRLEVGF